MSAELASGLGLTEGPLWPGDGRLLVVSVSRGLVYEVDPSGGGAHPVADVGGAPGALAVDGDGTIWIAQGGSALRREPDREVAPALAVLDGDGARQVVGEGLTAPNDLVADDRGRIWFTDPAGHPFDGDPIAGRVWAFDPERGRLELLLDEARYPNGLCFSPGRETFYLAETRARRVLAFPCRDGALGAAEVFAELPDAPPDGLAVDAAGNLLVAGTTSGAVVVLDPAGTELERLPIGEDGLPTNLCFGGAGSATLFVTSARGGRVFGLRRETPGVMPP